MKNAIGCNTGSTTRTELLVASKVAITKQKTIKENKKKSSENIDLSLNLTTIINNDEEEQLLLTKIRMAYDLEANEEHEGDIEIINNDENDNDIESVDYTNQLTSKNNDKNDMLSAEEFNNNNNNNEQNSANIILTEEENDFKNPIEKVIIIIENELNDEILEDNFFFDEEINE